MEIEKCAIIFRKYSLGNFEEFKNIFYCIDEIEIIIAWNIASNKIPNNEVLNDGKNLSFEQLEKVALKLEPFKENYNEIFNFLFDKIDITKLNPYEELIERRFRFKLAEKYLKAVSYNVNYSKPIRIRNFFRYVKYSAFIFLFLTVLNFNKIKDGLTPVDILTERIYNESKFKFDGAICNDGWVSHSQGRGTCSHHGGVATYFYEGDPKKSKAECRKEAILKSWLE